MLEPNPHQTTHLPADPICVTSELLFELGMLAHQQLEILNRSA